MPKKHNTYHESTHRQSVRVMNEFTRTEMVWIAQSPCGCAWLLDGTQVAYCPDNPTLRSTRYQLIFYRSKDEL